jgi:hypothetical protein
VSRARLASTIFRVMVLVTLPAGACARHALDENGPGAQDGAAGATGSAGGASGGTSGGTSPGTGGGATAGSRGGTSGGSPAPDGGPTSALEAAIQGWWSLGLGVGNCIQDASYYHFLPAGAAESVVVDDNACYPEMRGIFRTPETYQLAGTTLTLSQTDRWQRKTRQQQDVATGTIGMTRTLFLRIFKPVDAVTWHASTVTDTYDANGALASHHTVSVDLRFAAPLPAQGQGTCLVDVSYVVDGSAGRSPATACNYAPAGGIQRIEFVGFDFTRVSGGGPLSQVLTVFGQWMWLNPADPTYLYVTAWPGLDAAPPRL